MKNDARGTPLAIDDFQLQVVVSVGAPVCVEKRTLFHVHVVSGVREFVDCGLCVGLNDFLPWQLCVTPDVDEQWIVELLGHGLNEDLVTGHDHHPPVGVQGQGLPQGVEGQARARAEEHGQCPTVVGVHE